MHGDFNSPPSSDVRVEKFPSSDLRALQIMLEEPNVEDRRTGELLAIFLRGRGYGVHAGRLPQVALGMEEEECAPEQVQAALEQVALLM